LKRLSAKPTCPQDVGQLKGDGEATGRHPAKVDCYHHGFLETGRAAGAPRRAVDGIGQPVDEAVPASAMPWLVVPWRRVTLIGTYWSFMAYSDRREAH